MAHAFKKIPAKPAFGTLNQVGFQSDYISNKKAKITYCLNRVNTNYDQYNLYNKGRSIYRCILPFNKMNLVAGQYSKMNLLSVCTVIDGNPCSQIDSCSGCATNASINATTATEPFYQTNTIDPVGDLFGQSQCGINNYTRYMEYSPPIKHY